MKIRTRDLKNYAGYLLEIYQTNVSPGFLDKALYEFIHEGKIIGTLSANSKQEYKKEILEDIAERMRTLRKIFYKKDVEIKTFKEFCDEKPGTKKS